MTVSLEQLRPSSKPCAGYLDTMMQVIVIIAQLYIVRTITATRLPIPVRCFLREVRKCD